MSIYLLVLIDLPQEVIKPLDSRYTIIEALTPESLEEALPKYGSQIQAVLTKGTTGVSVEAMTRMPQLKIISCIGAGFENIDLNEAKKRNITVTNGHGANATCVADHAMALLLSLVRDIPLLNEEVKSGVWSHFHGSRPQVSGKRLGIFGLGTIGLEIAQRAAAFNMSIGYHNRSARTDIPYKFYDSVVELARNSDFLVISSPGGAETYHKINAEVFEALGSNGFVVNVARGTVVDTEALIKALKENKIAGAALDVIEGEPNVPEDLKKNSKVILTPHMAGRSPATMNAMIDLVKNNLDAYFDGRPVLTRVQ